MDPEKLQQLANLIARARAQGVSDREISSALRASPTARELGLRTVQQADTELQAQGIAPSESVFAGGAPRTASPQPEPTFLDRARGQLATVANMLPAGFGDEIAGAISPEFGEHMRGLQEVAEREDPLATGATKIAASIPAQVGVGRLFGLGKGGLQTIGAGKGLLARSSTGAAQVGAAGAADAGLFAAGLSEGDAGERLAAAGRAAPIGGVLGAGTGGLLGTASGSQQARRDVLASGGRLADDARSATGLSGRSSTLLNEAASIDRQARGLIRPLETGAQPLPPQTVQEIVNSPMAMRELKRIDTPEARAVVQRIESGVNDVGEIGMTFGMVDDVRAGLKHRADALARRSQDANAPLPSVLETQAAGHELRLIDEALDAAPGFTQSRRSFAQAGTMRRGLDEGRQAFNRTADDFVSGFENVAGGPAAQRAYREGGLHEMAASLNKGDAVETFLRRASQEGSETQQKLRVILGSDEAYDSFIQSIRKEKGVLTKAKILENLTKAAGFLFGGTSLVGGAGLIATS